MSEILSRGAGGFCRGCGVKPSPVTQQQRFAILAATDRPLDILSPDPLTARDVNKATDSKAKAKAEAEASVPWHKLVIMHNFFKNLLAIL